MRSRIPFYFLLLSLISVATAQTRTPSHDDAQEAAIVEQISTRVHYGDDGTGYQENSARIRIQSEAGVQAYGQLIFGYSSGTEKLEVDHVRVHKPDGQVVETPTSNEQDFAPEVLQSAPMYGDYRERHVTVVGLRPGDTLEYQVTQRTTTALAPGQFWFEYNFPVGRVVNQARLEIEVPQSRQLVLKSPAHKYATSDKDGWRTYTWTEENIKPKPEDRDAAAEDAPSDDDLFPDVQLTTFADWKQVASWYAKLQGGQVDVDDAIRAKAAELTRGATTPTQKAQRLYNFVALDFRYVSLSFGVGRYQPHSASEVLKAGYGDCKDKHTLLAALLKAENIPSYPVLIGAGRKLDTDVPSPAQFNHVMTLARLNDQLVWMDSTQEVAPYSLILFQLRDQEALVASDDSTAGVRKTPSDSPVKTTLTFSVDGKVSEVGTLDAIVDLKATGDDDVPIRMAFRSLPQSDWKQVAQQGWGGRNTGTAEISDVTVDSLEDTTKPFHLRYHVRQDKYFTVPTKDATFSPFPGMLPFASLPRKQSSQSLRVGPATETVYSAHLEFAPNFTLSPPSDVTMKRDYAEYSTIYRIQGKTLSAERKLVIKTNELPPSRWSDLQSFRGVVMNVPQQQISCNINPASHQAELAAVVPAGTDTKALHKAALTALQQRDFTSAVNLLKQVVEQNPKHPDAWAELGHAYAGLNQHDEAIAAFKKQIEIDPYHKGSYSDLGSELTQAGRSDEAVAAFRKQLENDALDRYARKSLGLLLLDMKHDSEALTELQAAAAIPPPDAEIQLALGEIYLRSGKVDEARPLLVRIVGSATPFPSGDIYSAALRDDGNPEQSLRDANEILSDIGEQFESGTYTELTPDSSSAMQFVALEWARLGWAKFQKGETLDALRYLNASWMLSQSGTVANRLGRVYEKAGQTANAEQMLALAVVAGGAEVDSSQAELRKLSPAGSDRLLTQAKGDLAQLSLIKIAKLNQKSGAADFSLIFDGSDKPDRVVYRAGDSELRIAEGALTEAKYPVRFPDSSSVKIIRSGRVLCSSSGCSLTLKPVTFSRDLSQRGGNP